MFKTKFLLFTCCIVYFTYSQNEIDALRYSLFDNYSTARVSGLGGSFSALGGNIGSIYSNPATLATYRTNEVSMTISSNNYNIETNYFNNINNTDEHKLSLQNIGYIQTFLIDNPDGWNRFNYAFSYNKKRDLNRTIFLSGHNHESSMANVFLNSAQGNTIDNLDGFTDYLAYYTYLINPLDTSTTNTNYALGINEIGQNQYFRSYESGAIDEYDISLSAAYKDFIFIGTSLTMTGITFSQYNRYTEDEFNVENAESPNDLTSFNYNQDLHVTGAGVSFKIGTIIKPTHFIRLGLAYHSKNYYEIEETYQTNMSTRFLDGFNENASSNLNYFDYELKTPSKSIASLAIVFAKKGLVTLDYETIDYGSSHLSSYLYTFSIENDNIANFYTRTNNIKLGLEWKIKEIAFRGGYAKFGSPFNNNLNDGSKEYLSAGIGFQKGAYFFDIAVIDCLNNEEYILYRDPTINNQSQVADISESKQIFLMSCSYKF